MPSRSLQKFAGGLFAASGGALLLWDAWTATSDPGLALGIALHLLLGVVLFLVIFTTGVGLVLLPERSNPPLDDLLLRAFLPGTLVAGIAAAAAVFAPSGGLVAVLIILGSLLPLARYRPDHTILARAGTTVALLLPAGLLLASMMAFRFHGPSATISADPMGDLSIYVHFANAIALGVVPLRNLGVEGATLGIGNMLPALLMTALRSWRWFDPFLFMTASLVVLAVLSFGLMLSLLARVWGAGASAIRGPTLWVVIALVAGAMRYPSWLVESPPIAFALPIIVSAVYLWRRDANNRRAPWQALVVGVVGSAVSKVVTLAVLAPMVVVDLARALIARLNWRVVALSLVALGAVAAYVVLMLDTYLALFLPNFSLDAHSTPLMLMRAAGGILLAIGASRMGVAGLALAAWSGIACYLVLPYLFHMTLTAVMILVALAIVEQPERLRRARPWIGSALAFLLPLPCLTDPGRGLIAGGWMLTTWFVVSTALAAASGTALGAAPPAAWRPIAAAGLAAVLAVLLATIGVGAFPARAVPAAGGRFGVLTPEMRDIWLAVRERTPSDSLIFTDQTGPTESRLGGWNDYALTSERQFFVVSWAAYAPLRFDEARRAEWLQRNADVLSGVLLPDQLRLSRKYAAYFAVISAERPPPPGAALIYGTAHYRLYRLAR